MLWNGCYGILTATRSCRVCEIVLGSCPHDIVSCHIMSYCPVYYSGGGWVVWCGVVWEKKARSQQPGFSAKKKGTKCVFVWWFLSLVISPLFILHLLSQCVVWWVFVSSSSLSSRPLHPQASVPAASSTALYMSHARPLMPALMQLCSYGLQLRGCLVWKQAVWAAMAAALWRFSIFPPLKVVRKSRSLGELSRVTVRKICRVLVLMIWKCLSEWDEDIWSLNHFYYFSP